MNRRQSARLDRKKFFADPVMLGAIFVLIVFLSLFILVSAGDADDRQRICARYQAVRGAKPA